MLGFMACGGGTQRVIIDDTPDDLTAAVDADSPVEFASTEAHAVLEGRRFQGMDILPEAWPRAASGSVDALCDNRIGVADYVLPEDERTPWSLIFRVLDGPQEIAAVGVATLDDERMPKDITLFSYLGNVPLSSLNFPQFIENSTRIGVFSTPRTDGFLVIELPEPVRAHYVWIRVTRTHGGAGGALSEFAVYSPDQLSFLRQHGSDRFSFASLGDIDTSPYQDANLFGRPDDGGRAQIPGSNLVDGGGSDDERESLDDTRDAEPDGGL